jgi:hypothetical protein
MAMVQHSVSDSTEASAVCQMFEYVYLIYTSGSVRFVRVVVSLLVKHFRTGSWTQCRFERHSDYGELQTLQDLDFPGASPLRHPPTTGSEDKRLARLRWKKAISRGLTRLWGSGCRHGERNDSDRALSLGSEGKTLMAFSRNSNEFI